MFDTRGVGKVFATTTTTPRRETFETCLVREPVARWLDHATPTRCLRHTLTSSCHSEPMRIKHNNESIATRNTIYTLNSRPGVSTVPLSSCTVIVYLIELNRLTTCPRLTQVKPVPALARKPKVSSKVFSYACLNHQGTPFATSTDALLASGRRPPQQHQLLRRPHT